MFYKLSMSMFASGILFVASSVAVSASTSVSSPDSNQQALFSSSNERAESSGFSLDAVLVDMIDVIGYTKPSLPSRHRVIGTLGESLEESIGRNGVASINYNKRCGKDKLPVRERQLQKAIYARDIAGMTAALEKGADHYQVICRTSHFPLTADTFEVLVSNGMDPKWNCPLESMMSPRVKFYNLAKNSGFTPLTPDERVKAADFVMSAGTDLTCRPEYLMHRVMMLLWDDWSEGAQLDASLDIMKKMLDAGAKDHINKYLVPVKPSGSFATPKSGKLQGGVWGQRSGTLDGRAWLDWRKLAPYVNLLVDAGLDPNSQKQAYYRKGTTVDRYYGPSILVYALGLGDFELANKLLKLGADPNLNLGHLECPTCDTDVVTAADYFKMREMDDAEAFILDNGGDYSR